MPAARPNLTPVPSEADVKTASAIADSAKPRSNTVELTNGIVLRIVPVPPLAMREVSIQVKPPEVPTVWMEDKQRDEPNPNDPDYLKALVEYSQRQVEMLTNIMLCLGTQVAEVPEGVDKPEDNDWIERIEFLGLHIDTSNKYQRYLSWLRYYALTSGPDISSIVRTVMQNSGTTEEEVQAIIKSFRSVA